MLLTPSLDEKVAAEKAEKLEKPSKSKHKARNLSRKAIFREGSYPYPEKMDVDEYEKKKREL